MRSVQKNLYLLIILLISFPLNVLAQNKTITGTVRDANDVVIGASVTVKDNLLLVLLRIWMEITHCLFRHRRKN